MEDDGKPEVVTSMEGNTVFVTPNRAATRAYDADDDETSDDESASDFNVGMIRVVVKMPTAAAENLELSVSQEASVLDLKKRITEELAIKSNDVVPVERQRLIFSGRMLTNNDDFLVDDINMSLHSPNYLHLAPLPQGVEPSHRRRHENAAASSDEERRPPLTRSRATRHLNTRDLRRSQASPYGLHSEATRSGQHRRPRHSQSQTTRPQLPNIPVYDTSIQPAAFPAAGLSVRPMYCQEQPVFFAAQPIGFADALALSASLEAVTVPVATAMVSPLALDATPMGLSSQVLAEDIRRDIWRRTNEILPLCRVLPDQLIRSIAASGFNPDRLQELRHRAELDDTATLLEQVAQRSYALANSLRGLTFARHRAAASQPPSVGGGVANPFADLDMYQDSRTQYY